MSELLLIVGNSGAGKDWVAANRFANFTLVKLNQPFKDQLEIDSGLEPGTCNDKSKRGQILTMGPFKDMPLRDAMVLSYTQCIKNWGYGAQFRTSTILKTLETLDKLAKTRTPAVITDLRKPEELRFLLEFAKLINYNIRMLKVVSPKEQPLLSDSSLEDNVNYYEKATNKPVEYCYNNY